MDREEILKRSRTSGGDEGVAYAENRGRRAGIMGFCGVYIAIKLFGLWAGQRSFAPDAMFWAYVAAEAWGRYRVSRKRGLLATVWLAAIASLAALACHVLMVLMDR